MRKSALLIIALLFAGFTQAQDKVWSLEKCIDYALSHNIQVKKQMLTTKSADIDLEQSKLNLLPSVNGSTGYSKSFKTVNQFTNQFYDGGSYSGSLNGSITIFNGFQKLNAIKQSLINRQASKYDQDKLMDDISLNIASTYLQILFYQELLNNAKAQLDVTNQQVDRMQKMVDAGTKAQGDLLNIQAQAASEEYQVVQAKNNLDLGYLSLYQLMDITNEDKFIIEAPKLTMLNQTTLQATPNSIYETALALQPSIKSADLRVKSAELGLKRTYSSLMPSISLSGSLNTGFSTKLQTIDQVIPKEVAIGYTKPGNVPVYSMSADYTYKDYKWNDQINGNIQKSFGVYMSIPIFSNYQGQNNVKRSKLNIESSKYDLQLAKQQLNKTIEQAYADSKAALNKYQSAEKAVSSTKESFHYSEQRFNVGLLSSVDYNTAKKELSAAESTLLQAKFDYLFRTTILDFYMGKPISLNIQ
ncbi:MAG: TolC family protein [Bacteroidetes bacterium]|nr:TolC family protein [Bacteroidota bacterium]